METIWGLGNRAILGSPNHRESYGEEHGKLNGNHGDKRGYSGVMGFEIGFRDMLGVMLGSFWDNGRTWEI